MISPRWRACLQSSFLLTFIFSFQLPAAVGEAPTFGFTEHMANKFFKPEGVRSLTITYMTVGSLLILATKIFPLVGCNFCIPLGNLYILTTLSLDNVWILLGENCCWSLLGHQGLVAIWLSGKHIYPSPLTDNTLRVHVLAHLQSLHVFVSLLLCISATKTQWNRTSEFLGMCHGHWRPPVLCMAGYPAENGKCCKVYVQERNITVIISKVLSEEECLASLNPIFCFKWQEVSVNVGLWEG